MKAGEAFKRYIVPALIVVGVLLSSILGFSSALKQKSGKTDYAKWMAALNNNTSLREVNMPGSHDTMATISIGNLAGQCQSLSLEDQLNLGVRFLDIRLQQVKGDLKAVHGIVDQKVRFDEINSVVNRFLENNPTEFIIMSVKEETKASNPVGSFEDVLKNKLSERYLLGRDLPNKVGEVRGKVVLLSRYKGSSIGVDAYAGWLDSTSFTLPNSDIYIQDEYKITSGEQKINAITNCFNETGHALKINFLSAYRTNMIPPSYAPTAAHDVNTWVEQNIKNYHDRGIVLYDFVTEANMRTFFGGNA